MSNYLLSYRSRVDPPIEGGQLSNNKVCSGHSSNRCANNSNNNGNNNNNISAPLMSVAHLNGQVSGISARGMTATASHAATSSNSAVFSTASTNNAGSGTGSTGSDPLTSLSTSTSNPYNHFSGPMDVEFDFLQSNWESLVETGPGWTDRPESRASGPPNSRPPSQPAPTASPSPQGATFSNSAVPSHCSPLSHPFSPVNAGHAFSNSFPFSPLQETASTLSGNAASSIGANGGSSGGNGSGKTGGTNGNVATTTIKKEEASKSGCPNNNSVGGGSNSGNSGAGGGGNSGSGTTMDSATGKTNNSNNAVTAVEAQNNNVVSTESGRLRNLLTKGPSASEDSQDNTNSDADNQNKHRILKILLNQQDDDDYHSEHKVRTSPSNMSKSGNMEHSKSSLGNNMLLQVIKHD